MARRLKTIAKEINETLEGYSASVYSERLNTDRKFGRLRWPGKGIPGNCIRIYKGWECVFSHHTGTFGRTNEDVEQWLRETKQELEEGDS